MLPHEAPTRLSFIQHNVLDGLPFEDAKFDLVRISQLAMALPGSSPSLPVSIIKRSLTEMSAPR
jgi:hypothetical protein